MHARPSQFGWAKSAANDADLPSRQCKTGSDRLDVRLAIHVFLAPQSVGNAHRLSVRDDVTLLEGQNAAIDAYRSMRTVPLPGHPPRFRTLPAAAPIDAPAAASGYRRHEKV